MAMFDAAWDGRAAEVLSLLRDNPGLDVNNTDTVYHCTALHFACWNRNVEVVKVLLAWKYVNVNLQDRIGRTPFAMACVFGSDLIVKLLLKDFRVNTTLENNDGCSPLWNSSFLSRDVPRWLSGSLQVAEIWQTLTGKGPTRRKNTLPLKLQEKQENTKVGCVCTGKIHGQSSTHSP